MSDYGIKTYADLAETCGGMVLANEMAYCPMELVSGSWAPWEEIFQWYIVQDTNAGSSISSREISITRDITERSASSSIPGCASRSSAASHNLTSILKTEASASTSSCRGAAI